MKKHLFAILALSLVPLMLSAQTPDRHDVRKGNRKFRHDNFKEAEIDYRKAVVKDSTSFAATYDLASALYRQKDYDGAGKVMEKISEQAVESVYGADYYFNLGDIAIQKEDWQGAVNAFKESLLRNPSDLQAKQNYIYAKKKLENQQQNQDQQSQDQQNQDQNQDQQNQPQNQPQDQQDQQQNPQPQEQQISPQQAQQMLQAIQAKEKETQDKVEKKKADALKARQREKNW